jgi:hypothetical protein
MWAARFPYISSTVFTWRSWVAYDQTAEITKNLKFTFWYTAIDCFYADSEHQNAKLYLRYLHPSLLSERLKIKLCNQSDVLVFACAHGIYMGADFGKKLT